MIETSRVLNAYFQLNNLLINTNIAFRTWNVWQFHNVVIVAIILQFSTYYNINTRNRLRVGIAKIIKIKRHSVITKNWMHIKVFFNKHANGRAKVASLSRYFFIVL